MIPARKMFSPTSTRSRLVCIDPPPDRKRRSRQQNGTEGSHTYSKHLLTSLNYECNDVRWHKNGRHPFRWDESQIERFFTSMLTSESFGKVTEETVIEGEVASRTQDFDFCCGELMGSASLSKRWAARWTRVARNFSAAHSPMKRYWTM